MNIQNNGIIGGIKSAAVANIEHTFWSGQINSNGIAVHYITLEESLLYFAMPSWMQNGQAATLSAQALNQALEDTASWFRDNFNATGAEIGVIFRQNLTARMAGVNGSYSTTPYFDIPNPAPYETSVWGTGNCNT